MQPRRRDGEDVADRPNKHLIVSTPKPKPAAENLVELLAAHYLGIRLSELHFACSQRPSTTAGSKGWPMVVHAIIRVLWAMRKSA